MPKRKTAPKKKAVDKTKSINRLDLLQALKNVMPGISAKETTNQSNHFIFMKNKIISSNDEMIINCNFESVIKGAVKATEFYNLIEKIKSDEINIDMKKDSLAIKAKDFKSNFKIKEESENTNIDINYEDKKWMKLPKNFIDAIDFCLFSVSKNMSINLDFTCIYFTKKDKESFAISCDGFRGSKYNLDGNIKESFLLPATAAKHLKIYKPTKYAVDENWIHFSNEKNIVISCRIIADEFNKMIWDFFDTDGEEIIFPDELIAAIAATSIMSISEFDQDRFISLTINNGKLTCKGEGYLGDAEKEIDIDYKGDKIELKIHPVLLADILKRTTTMYMDERLKFKDENFEHVICQTVS